MKLKTKCKQLTQHALLVSLRQDLMKPKEQLQHLHKKRIITGQAI